MKSAYERSPAPRPGAAQSPPAAALLDHQALDPPHDGEPLERAVLTDQQRLAVVLQGAALLAHLDYGGLVLAGGWRAARLAADGRLIAGGLRRGRPDGFNQAWLVALVEILFRGPEVAGRGMARRAARRLLERWRPSLTPLAGDRAVAQILDLAPFLWQPPFAVARRALAAVHQEGRRRRLRVAGPGPCRRRFLARARDRLTLERLLAGPRAQDLWSGWRRGLGDPLRLVADGRPAQAVIVWERRPPTAAPQVLAFAEALYALGRYERARSVLQGARSVAARLLRARCQEKLGELRAARATLDRLAATALSGPATVEAAELAVKLLANQGRPDAVRDWVARALAAGRGRWQLRARLLAALAAWDEGDAGAMDRHLQAAAVARDDPDLAWRWHHARGLRSHLARDGDGVVTHVATALRQARRRLPRERVGRLWNELALGRVLIDDLAGAERACRHALRRLQECDGTSATTLVLPNLAEVRLRRGRLAGVGSILEVSMRENRRADNVRGLLADLELWARYELAQGRTAAALARCVEARELVARRPAAGDLELVRVLEARARGWQGQADAASAALGDGIPAALAELEPEEGPALLALAGRRQQASELAHGTPWAPLWRSLAAGRSPSAAIWDELSSLAPYRAARLIFDCELVQPGMVPSLRVRQAADTLRRCGAEPMAERLEGRSLSAWRAVERYLQRRTAASGGAWAALLAGAGYDDVRLVREDDAGRRRVLVAGPGGEETLTADDGGGRLVLSAAAVDSRLRALFALIRRDLPAAPGRLPPPPATGGMIGASAALRTAVERLGKLAKAELPLLILGESGTGKELAARYVHRSSARAGGPFLAVNCAALSESLITSDLFGHVRGAFTGADRDRPGVFEAARGGTVFLDEIGDLPPPVQGMLLRVLQEGEIRRLGESHPRGVDVRVVTATHRDLERMVAEGTFRQDLYFRLKVAMVRLPPLRDRDGDVLLLANHFVERVAGSRLRLSRAAREQLSSHPWPGNVRELKNVLEVAAALAGEGEITPEHLDLPHAGSAAGSEATYHAQLEAFRRQLIDRALRSTGGNRAAAARQLGLSRQALSYMVRQLGLIHS